METIETISKWAEATFGETSPIMALSRAMDEIAELRKHWHQYPDGCDEQMLVEEAADVCITLYRYIYMVDKKAIEKKMAINRQRTWILDGNGNGQHA